MAKIIADNQNSNPLVFALLDALSGKPSKVERTANMLPADVSMTQGQGSWSNPGGMTFSPNPGGYSPPIDLAPLIISGKEALARQGVPQPVPAPAPVPVAQEPQTPVPSMPVNNINEPSRGGFDLGRILTQLGIPLATAGVGLAVPGALPGAAGFQTGYTGELAKDRESQRKSELTKGLVPTYGIDAEGKPTITGYVQKGSKTFKNTQPTEQDVQKDAQHVFDSITKADPGAGLRYSGNPELMNRTIQSIADQIRIKYGVASKEVGKEPVETTDPIANKIKELKGKYTDEQIAGFLKEKNIDPSKYGL